MLFTFPSRYLSTIGLSGVFSLAGWSRRIRSGFLVSRLTQDTAMLHVLACTGLSPSMIAISKTFHFVLFSNVAVLLPRGCRKHPRFGLIPGRSPLLGESRLFSIPAVLRCFSSLRLPALRHDASSMQRVVPFGNPRIKGHLHLPAAYRSLSRPSSPLRA